LLSDGDIISVMNVLVINTSDTRGGAAMAAWRLKEALSIESAQTRFLVADQQQYGHPDVNQIQCSFGEQLLGKLLWRHGFDHINCYRTRTLLDHPWVKSADVIHLNNLHGGFFNYRALGYISQRKPVVWTLHDMWAFTGHCSYSYACERWITGCGQCPHLKEYPYMQRDVSHWEWWLKKQTYAASQFQIVTPSHWLKALVEVSLLKQFTVRCIPYGLDTQVYQPMERTLLRQKMSIPPDAFVVLISSNDLNEERKGGRLILEALTQLPSPVRSRFYCLIMGKGRLESNGSIRGLSLGYITDESLKAEAYAVSDLCLFASSADNLPLVIQESLSCGTPVLACPVGGIPEMVIPGRTGFLSARTPAALSQTLGKIMNNLPELEALRDECRQFALQRFTMRDYGANYLSVYQQAIEQYAAQKR
jgi:glycosyltransferase involved in cell wall biosynthesis